MKPIENYLTDERAHNAVMIVQPDEKDTFDKEVVFDFDFVFEIMQKIRKEIRSRKKQTKVMKHDNRTIQFRFKENTSGVLLMRVYRENENVMYPEKDTCIVIAPTIPANDEKENYFHKYDSEWKDRLLKELASKEEDFHEQGTELIKNGMFRDKEENDVPLSGSDAECNANYNDADEIAEFAKLLGMEPVKTDVI
jgi:hypothetical protein